VVTALNPYIDYANVTEVAQEALATGKSVYDLVLERKLLPKDKLDAILQPDILTKPQPLQPTRE
jgi:aspartate ammonia-lyase